MHIYHIQFTLSYSRSSFKNLIKPTKLSLWSHIAGVRREGTTLMCVGMFFEAVWYRIGNDERLCTDC